VFVGIAAGPVELVPDPREVAQVAVVPLSRFLDPEVFHVSDRLPEGHDPGEAHVGVGPLPAVVDLPFFTLAPDVVVWGTQGSIMRNFLELLLAT
jgi:hypothetical protein